MKNVILIGDSIRMGYQPFVQEALQGRAQVWGPEENGGTSRNVLEHLDEWALERKADLIHLNCGLHDIARSFETGEYRVPIDEYDANLRRIFERLSAGSALVAWATITPVNESNHHATKGFDRFEADLDAYNEVALRVVRESNIPVDDLYSLVMQNGRDDLLCFDGVHYEEAGSRLLGQAVVKFVGDVLKI